MNFEITPFPVSVYCDFSPTEKQGVKKIAEKLKIPVFTPDPEKSNEGGGLTTMFGSQVVLWIDPRAERKVVFHEAWHVWEYLCEYTGMDGSDSESAAYIIADITENILTLWEQARKRRKIK